MDSCVEAIRVFRDLARRLVSNCRQLIIWQFNWSSLLCVQNIKTSVLLETLLSESLEAGQLSWWWREALPPPPCRSPPAMPSSGSLRWFSDGLQGWGQWCKWKRLLTVTMWMLLCTYAGLHNMRDAGMLHPRHFFSPRHFYTIYAIFTRFLRDFCDFYAILSNFYAIFAICMRFLRDFCDFYAIFCQAQNVWSQAPKTIIQAW